MPLDVGHRHVVFTVPRSLRGVIERERWLHGLMARAAWDTPCQALGAAALEPDGVPGAVVSLQTLGSFGANLHLHLHLHLHVLVSDGVLARDGCFHTVVWPEEAEFEQRFRRLYRPSIVDTERRPRFVADSTAFSAAGRAGLDLRALARV